MPNLHYPNPVPQNSNLEFNEVDVGYVVDENVPNEQIPYLIRNPRRDDGWVGLFGRKLGIGDPENTISSQFLFVWDFQKLPPHQMDYEPVFFYGDSPNYQRIFYDRIHYWIGKREITNPETHYQFQYHSLWRSFRSRFVEQPPPDNNILIDTVQPLTDAHLNHWWNITRRGRLKIVKKFRNPEKVINAWRFNNPHAFLILEELTFDIRYLVIYFILETESLSELLLKIGKELISPKPTRIMKKINKEHLIRASCGYNSFLLLLNHYELIEIYNLADIFSIKTNRDILENTSLGIFIKSLEKSKYLEHEVKTDDISKFLTNSQNLLHKEAFFNTLIEIKETESGNQYFKDLKETIKTDGFIYLELEKWYLKSKDKYNISIEDYESEFKPIPEEMKKGWTFSFRNPL